MPEIDWEAAFNELWRTASKCIPTLSLGERETIIRHHTRRTENDFPKKTLGIGSRVKTIPRGSWLISTQIVLSVAFSMRTEDIKLTLGGM